MSERLATLRFTPPAAERPLPFLSVPVTVGDMGSGNDWHALAHAIKRRRVALGHQRQKSFAETLPFGARLLGELENGRRDTYDQSTLTALENALLWAPGSVEAVLSGREPNELPLPTPEPGQLSAMGNAELVAHVMSAVTELARRLPEGRPMTGDPLIDYPGGSVFTPDDMPDVDVTIGRDKIRGDRSNG